MKNIVLFGIMSMITLNVTAQSIQIPIKSNDLLIEDFEGDTYIKWTFEGNAFGDTPVFIDQLIAWGDSRFEGKRMMSSFVNGDAGTGTMTSFPFTIERKYINFLIGGGFDIQREYVALKVDGKEVRKTTGYNRRTMENESWDVSEFLGKEAQIILVDQSKEGWGFINADCFFQSNTKFEKEFLVRNIRVTHRYLNIPVRTGAIAEQIDVIVDGKLMRNMEVELDGERPDFWVTLEVSEWLGKDLGLRMTKMSFTEKAIEKMFFSDVPKEADSFYKESLRPKVHFTSKRGWLNDPNGLVWYAGEWHLFYQHNPYGFNWNNMTWGHAVSPDLVHWKEVGDVLHPDSLGPVFSGSAVVDYGNTLGLSDKEALVAVYTSAGGVGYHTRHLQHSQSIAYSLDKGRTWTKYSGNPVLPTLVCYNRDPKVMWHKPTQKWIMVLFLDKQEYAIFSSPDLKEWTETDRFKLDGADECPDFFEMSVENEQPVRKWVFTGANSTYLVGTFDGKKFIPETKPVKMDNGNNYYAVQTYSNAPERRRVQIAWMNGSAFPGMPFNQQMSFPRELKLYKTLNSYRLKSLPVREICSLYKTHHKWENVQLEVGKKVIADVEDKAFYLKSTIDINTNKGKNLGFDIGGLIVSYNVDKQLLYVQNEKKETLKQIPLESVDGKVELDILSDIGSVEIFANNGELSAAFYHLSEKKENNLSLICEEGKGTFDTVIVNQLASMYVP